MLNTPNALDPLMGIPASSDRESVSAAVDVLAPLLGIDADSPEGDQLRQHLLDMDGSLTSAPWNGLPNPGSGAPPSHSVALAIMPTSRRFSVEVALAAQRDDAWRAALASGETAE